MAGQTEGSEEARKRLRVILETISGTRSIAQACEELGIGEARFHELRRQALQGAVEALEPGQAGRPPVSEEKDEKLAAMEAELIELRINLRAAQIREEIAAIMPHVLKPRAPDVKKTADKNSSQDLFGRGPSGGGRKST